MNVFQRQSGHLYFLYGTNLHPELIAARCGSPAPLGAARVVDFQLAFFGHTAVWDGGEESAVPQAGGEIWGGLYRLTFEQADRLDDWQGCRPDGSGPYFLFPVSAVDVNGTSHAALLYRKDTCGSSLLSQPSDAQRDFIVTAARAQSLPDAYVAKLERLDSQKAHYPVPKLDGSERWRSVFRCQGCE